MTTPADPPAELVAFIRAQLDEAERRALRRKGDHTQFGPFELDPDDALADIESKRRILDRWAELRSDVLDALGRDEPDEAPTATEFAYEQVARLLALPFADRPGFREEWRPS